MRRILDYRIGTSRKTITKDPETMYILLYHIFRILHKAFQLSQTDRTGRKDQTMTEAEHNRPIPKLFIYRPSASAAEVFGLLREPIIFFENNM